MSSLMQHMLGIGGLFCMLVLIPIIRRKLMSRESNPVGAAMLLFGALVIVSFVYSSKAHAGVVCATDGPSNTCDEGEAWADCLDSGAKAKNYLIGLGYPNSDFRCVRGTPTAPWHSCFVGTNGSSGADCADVAGGLGAGRNHYYVQGSCATRPERTDFFDPTPGDDSAPTYCDAGCTFVPATASGGPGTVIWVPAAGDLCDASNVVVDTDGDGVPDAEDAFPNDPNESVDSDGDGIGDNADIAPDDPTNGEDAEGEEDGDDEGDNSATGGADCKAPPACKGDGIACNTNYQVWKARCAAEANGGTVTGSPGTCGAAYTCTGPAVQCAQLHVQRQALCADADGGDGHGSVVGGSVCSTPYVCTGGDAIACAQLREAHRMRCLTVGDGDGDTDDMGPELDPGDYFGVGQGGDTPLSLDASGWLGSGACPSIVEDTFKFQGSSAAFCNGGSVLGFYVLFLAYLTAARIIGRSVTGGGA